MDAGVYEMHDRNIIVKVKFNLEVNTPILYGIYISSKNNGVCWVDFRYEKLPMFCFYRGFMGHNEEHFSKTTPKSWFHKY